MPQHEKLLYTAKVRTAGAREKGVSRSSDGRLDVTLSVPGAPGAGTNPEQLFAAGWSACFEGAMADAAERRHDEGREGEVDPAQQAAADGAEPEEAGNDELLHGSGPPCTGCRRPTGVVGEVAGRAAQRLLDARHDLGVATIENNGEEFIQ